MAFRVASDSVSDIGSGPVIITLASYVVGRPWVSQEELFKRQPILIDLTTV